MKVLVLASEPIGRQQLSDALPGDVEPDQVEVMVVAPALQQSPIKFWLSDADDAIAKADWVRREAVEQLGSAGVAASGDTGESDPASAIQDALLTFPADRIILFTHAEHERRYREDLDVAHLRERFEIPVDQATVENRAA